MTDNGVGVRKSENTDASSLVGDIKTVGEVDAEELTTVKERVLTYAEENPFASYDEISGELKIQRSKVERIFRDHFGDKREYKKKRVIQEIQSNPYKDDEKIAKKLGCSAETVRTRREEAEDEILEHRALATLSDIHDIEPEEIEERILNGSSEEPKEKSGGLSREKILKIVGALHRDEQNGLAEEIIELASSKGMI